MLLSITKLSNQNQTVNLFENFENTIKPTFKSTTTTTTTSSTAFHSPKICYYTPLFFLGNSKTTINYQDNQIYIYIYI